MGSKPMIDFYIDSGYPETEEECKLDYTAYLNTLRKEKREVAAMDYEQYSSMCKKANYKHHRKLWDVCEQKLNEYVGPCYRFVKAEKVGYFINIPITLLTLNEYYNEFSQVNGEAFTPEKVIHELSDQTSPFWNRIFQSSYAVGLLLGYGKKNSFIFSWEQKNNISLPRYVDLEHQLTAMNKIDVTVKDLALPSFCTFSLGDQVMENYKREREEILKEFVGKDFEYTVRKWLKRGSQTTHEMRELR
jgi:hypothetical protein